MRRVGRYIMTSCMTTTIWSMVIIAVDRYKAIVHSSEARSSFSRAKVNAMILWGLSFSFNIYILFVPARVIKPKHRNTGTLLLICGERWMKQLTETLRFAGIYIVPLTIVTILYSHITCYLNRHKNMTSSSGNSERHKKRAVLMMVTIVVFFAVCWLPSILCELITVWWLGPRMPIGTKDVTFLVGCFNSLLNVIAYGYFSEPFRKAAARILKFHNSPTGDIPTHPAQNQTSSPKRRKMAMQKL